MSTPTSKELLIIPTSEVKFMALKDPVKGFNTDEKKYTIRVEVDGSTAEGQEIKAKIAATNPNRINSKNVTKDGNFTLTFSSKYPVEVLDASGQAINPEDVPRLGQGGHAKAKIMALVDTARANPKLGVKGAMYLKKVQLMEVTGGTTEDFSDAEAELRKMLAEA